MAKHRLLHLILFLCMVIAVYVGHSQGSNTQSLPPLAPNTPLDGGIFLLLAAGLIYGGKVLYSKE